MYIYLYIDTCGRVDICVGVEAIIYIAFFLGGGGKGPRAVKSLPPEKDQDVLPRFEDLNNIAPLRAILRRCYYYAHVY